jgi:uncharacterized protein (DUF433 family)
MTHGHERARLAVEAAAPDLLGGVAAELVKRAATIELHEEALADQKIFAEVTVASLKRAKTELAQCVWVTPQRLGGAACVGGTRISAITVARIAVDGIDAVLVAYPDLTRVQVLIACWYVAQHGAKRWADAWGAWADEHEQAMWSGNWDKVPDPPCAAVTSTGEGGQP